MTNHRQKINKNEVAASLFVPWPVLDCSGLSCDIVPRYPNPWNSLLESLLKRKE